MREIKFKVWSGGMFLDGNDANITAFNPSDTEITIKAGVPHKEYILCQFTGLKDKNGKEIYEGDIIKWKRSEQEHQDQFYEQVNRVNYGRGGFYVGSVNFSECHTPDNILVDRNTHMRGAMDTSIYEIDFDFEVIGNIYENKELLK